MLKLSCTPVKQNMMGSKHISALSTVIIFSSFHVVVTILPTVLGRQLYSFKYGSQLVVIMSRRVTDRGAYLTYLSHFEFHEL